MSGNKFPPLGKDLRETTHTVTEGEVATIEDIKNYYNIK